LAHCPGEHQVLPETLARPLLITSYLGQVCVVVSATTSIPVFPSIGWIHVVGITSTGRSLLVQWLSSPRHWSPRELRIRLEGIEGARVKGTTNMKLTTCRMRPRAAKQGTKRTLRALVDWTRAQMYWLSRWVALEPTISELTNRT